MVVGAPQIPFTSFEVPLEIVVLGLITGLSYAILGMGLALTYKSSRVLNFAHGEIGALPARVLAILVALHGWPYVPAFLLAVVMAVAGGVLVERLVIRRLASSSRLVALVATIGVSQVFLVIGLLIPQEGLAGNEYPTPFTASVTIGNLRLGAGQLMILGLVPLIALAITVFLRRSKLGLGSRAAAENLDAARLAGVPASWVSLVAWVLAALLSAAAAILIGPTKPIAVGAALGPQLLLRALAAAMVGGLVNLRLVFVSGVAIGLVEFLVGWNYPAGGLVELTLLALVVVSLVARRGLGSLLRGGEQSSWSLSGTLRALEPALARHPRVRLARRVAAGAALAVAAALPVFMGSDRRVLMSSVLLFAIMGLSVVVITGFAGQISLGQFGFVSIGAVVGGRMAQLGYPVWMGLLFGVLAGGLVGLLIGLPAVRIRGLFLAVTTLGFTVAGGSWLLRQEWLVNTDFVSGTSLRLPRQEMFGVDFQDELNYYWLCLAMFVVAVWVVNRIRDSGVGRRFMAVRDNEPAAAALSVSPSVSKLSAFVLSGMIAAFAGYWYGGLLVNFSQAGLFSPTQSLNLVAMTIFGGVTTVSGAVLGAIWVQGIPYLFGDNVGLLSSGLGLLIVLLVFPGGLASVGFIVRDRVVRILAGDRIRELDDERADAAAAGRKHLAPRTMASPGDAAPDGSDLAVPLRAENIVVNFGGNLAVDDASVHANAGELVGLVGPNGAGKTTLFDVLSGQLRPSAGRVFLFGDDITDLRPDERARAGMGRSFQQARLFAELSLLDAFKVALEREQPTETFPSALGLPPSRAAERAKDLRAHDIVDLLGLGPFSRLLCSELSTGTRRLAELGLQVAMGAQVILLDEPTAGIAQREVEAFIPVVREIRDHLDATMIVIDHNIPTITGLVDRLYVMAAGKIIAEGEPEAVRQDPKVVAVYLGTDERTIARSGVLVK